MPPRLSYKKYPITIIRPLCMAPVTIIKEHAQNQGYSSTTCTCSYQDNSGRKEARKRLEALTQGNNSEKQRLFNALRNVRREYLTYPYNERDL
jgi:tRNA(Ile)-lysidine synthase TilS/MesJ